MEYITLGKNVNIKRTDGRVHAAVVSKINEAARSITVEWYERGETKGKEVELEAILALNPELLQASEQQQQQQQQQHAAPEPKKQLTAPMNLSRNPTHSSIGNSSNRVSNNRLTMQSNGGIVGGGSSSGGAVGVSISGSVSSVLNEIMEHNNIQQQLSSTATAASTGIATTGMIRPRNTNILGSSSSSSVLPTRIASATTISSIATAAATATTNQTNISNNERINTTTATIGGGGGGGSGVNNSSNNATNNTTSGSTGSNAGPRRSYVVKEVERLKENREKRRARQAEIKEEKVALMNQDPGNPNWETAQMIREYQNTLEFYPLLDGQAVEDHQITVCVRKRPLSRKEVNRKEIDVISVPRKDMLVVHEPRNKVDLTKFLENHKFRFDYAFNEQCDNAMVYKYTAKPLVKTIFEGGMATCFAYGQTGSGKTHTMGGEFNGKVQDCKNGIYAMAAKDVFATLNNPRYRSLNLVVSASFFEIYSGKVFDLLADKQKLRVLEDGKQQVQVVGLTEKVVDSVEEVLRLIQHGNNARTSGQTSANSNSSRSHAVFQIVLRPPGSAKIHGKFSFIDLAGNERGADTSSANRQTRMEGAEINKSLLALKECIRALGKQSAHLPFRVSKLTQVLRDSFIGEKSKTCMIAMISPGLSSCEHTLNTLRYADRVKELVVKDTPDVLREEEEIMEEEEEEELDDELTMKTEQLPIPMQGGGGGGTAQHRGMQKLQQQHHNHHHHNNNNNNNKNGPATEMDLALLHSLSEHDMSDELLVQHAAINDLQQTEEMVVDQHRTINEFLEHFLAESKSLYDLTNYVDYDQDAYCRKGEAMFKNLVDIAIACRDMMADYRGKLTKEEMLSCNFKQSPNKR